MRPSGPRLPSRFGSATSKTVSVFPLFFSFLPPLFLGSTLGTRDLCEGAQD